MRTGKHVVVFAVCTIAVLIAGCGKKGDEGSTTQSSTSGGSEKPAATQPQAPGQSSAVAADTSGGAPSPTDMATIAAQNRETLTKMNQGKEIAAVEGATLKGLLPEELAGMKRTDASSERNQMMGMDMSKAEGQYEGQNDASLDLTLTDMGNMSGPMKMGMVGWTMAQYNRETDNGYEKTAAYSGYKGLEEYNTQDKDGTIKVFVADRFIIELHGSNTTMDTIKQALGQIDLKKLASLASGS